MSVVLPVLRLILLIPHRYLFLLERVHVVRAPFVDRIRDPVWVIGAILIMIGFVVVTAFESISPRSELSRVDGVCRIGIQPHSGYALIALDTTINLVLTGIFIWQLRPALGVSVIPWLPNRTSGSGSGWKASQRNVKAMLLRNVLGTSLLLCTTITNNTLFLTRPFAVYSHACQLMCVTDSKYENYRGR